MNEPLDRPETSTRPMIQVSMIANDDLVICFDYTGASGAETHRVVSPIKFVGPDRFLGLCLSREEPRTFYLSRCRNLQLAPAAEFLMPVAMEAADDKH